MELRCDLFNQFSKCKAWSIKKIFHTIYLNFQIKYFIFYPLYFVPLYYNVKYTKVSKRSFMLALFSNIYQSVLNSKGHKLPVFYSFLISASCCNNLSYNYSGILMASFILYYRATGSVGSGF